MGKGWGGKKKEVVRGRREGGKERKTRVATAATLVLAKTRSITSRADFKIDQWTFGLTSAPLSHIIRYEEERTAK